MVRGLEPCWLYIHYVIVHRLIYVFGNRWAGFFFFLVVFFFLLQAVLPLRVKTVVIGRVNPLSKVQYESECYQIKVWISPPNPPQSSGSSCLVSLFRTSPKLCEPVWATTHNLQFSPSSGTTSTATPEHVLQPGLLCRFTPTKIAAAWSAIWSTLAQALWFINCFSGHKSLL